MSDASTLYDFAQELLELAEDCLQESVGGVPVVSYVSTTLPTLDCCPQLTVDIRGITFDDTIPSAPSTIQTQRVRLGSVIVAQFVITIVRCTPQPDGLTGKPPPPLALEQVAAEVAQDGWLLWNCLANAQRNGSLWEGRCLSWYLDQALPQTESGSCAGWTIFTRARIQGFAGTAS